MKVNAPDLMVVAIPGIFAPDVLDAFVRECRVERSSAVDRGS
jgi:hypothetical protein